MPSYSELTPDEIVDLARYIHFLRQQARFRELSRLTDTPAGDRAAGEVYFNGAANCRSCHSTTGDLKAIGRRYDTARLRERLLRPGPPMPGEGVTPTAGEAAHLRLLENYTAANVQDLVAFLGAVR
jgi:mono/diheme cytochrome c family protein